MAIAHDTDARFPTSLTAGDTTTGDRSFTYTPVGTPAGVVVVVMCQGTAQPCTGVTYGGLDLSLITNATDTSEAGSVWIWALTGVAIPTGAQTVVLQGCIAASKVATVSTVTSATGLSRVNTNNFKNTTTAANPTLSLVTTDTTILYGAVHGGAASPSSYAAGGADITIQYSMDYGALSARSARGTSPIAAGSHTFDFVFATSDDYCIAAVAIAEVSPTQTSVARISLASGSEPASRTAHQIKVRARVTSGAGKIRAALYEGANNRSGDLESEALTTSLAEYTLAIPDANAANITDYSDLEIRLWGYSASGGSIVYEVDQLWLEIPEAGGGAVSFAVSIAGAGTVTANTVEEKVIAATVSGVATIAALAAASRPLGATVAGASTVTPSLAAARPLSSSIAGAGSITADLGGVSRALNVGCAGTSTISANLASSRALAVGTAGAGAIAANFVVDRPLQTAIAGVGGIAADLTVTAGGAAVALDVTVAGSSTVTVGDIAPARALNAAVVGTSTVALGPAVVDRPIAVSILGTSTVVGTTFTMQQALFVNVTGAGFILPNLTEPSGPSAPPFYISMKDRRARYRRMKGVHNV